MVFYNNRYASAEEAIGHSDGLTVLAFFYEVRGLGNPQDKHRESDCSILPRNVPRHEP